MKIEISEDDFGNIYVFDVAGEVTAAEAEKSPETLQELFGQVYLDPTYVDVVDTSALAGLKLSDYLHQGYDIPYENMNAEAIDALEGHAILVLSRAFGGNKAVITTGERVRHITTASLQRAYTQHETLRTPSAEGQVGGKQKKTSDAAMSGRVATIALIVLFAVVGLMIWVAS